MVLVPVKVEGDAMISTEKAQFGTYVYLTEDVNISPKVLCVLLRRPPSAEPESKYQNGTVPERFRGCARDPNPDSQLLQER